MTSDLRRTLSWIIGAVVTVLIAALLVVVFTGGTSSKTITADFAEAPGLYPGNHVDVLGIPVGVVTKIQPGPNFVAVTLHVRSNLPIPANASAEIMAPQVVADRFVQLLPAYQGGPTMPAGAVIPASRTAIPQSVDAVIGTLNELAAQLGPNGVNKNGALTNLVGQLAKQFGGVGPDFHRAVVNFSQGLHGVAAASPAVAGIFNNLGNLSQALANNSTTYRSFANDLTAVSGLLANDRAQIGAVFSSLQQLFADLTDFIQRDGANLGASVANLNTFASALVSQQAALAQAFDLSPLSLQNLDNTIDTSARGGAALRARYDPVSATQGLFNQVCGNAALRFLVILATGTQTNPLTVATPVDTLCGVGNALNALTPPPGATLGPDLTLRMLAP